MTYQAAGAFRDQLYVHAFLLANPSVVLGADSDLAPGVLNKGGVGALENNVWAEAVRE